MTLATDLTLLAATKTAIKAAIENKGVTVGAIPFSQYPAKIDSISSNDGVWTQQKYDAVLAAASSNLQWADWRALSPVGPTEQRFSGLYPVYEQGVTYCAIHATGAYTVDWGDGVVENFDSGIQANHIYSFASAQLGGVVASVNAKQAIVTVTPQAGHQLTSISCDKFHPSELPTWSNTRRCRWLEVSLGSPYFTGITLRNTIFGGGGGSSLVKAHIANMGLMTVADSMFYGCASLTIVSMSNTASVTNMSNMFNRCHSLAAVSLFDTASVTTLDNMFTQCAALTTVPLFNTASVTNMSNMFQSCTSLTTVPLFNTASVTNMSNMFQGCAALTTVPLFNTASVTTMSGMFLYCASLTTVPLFNTASVTSMSNMFQGGMSLTTVPLFNTASVRNMSSMFSQCRVLTTVPLFNTASVTNISSMFNQCTSLAKVPLFNTASVTTMSGMFGSCYSLTTIPLFNTASVTATAGMFTGCPNLRSVPALNFNATTSSDTFPGNLIWLTSVLATFRIGVSLINSGLSALALNEFFAAQPSPATAGAILAIAGNPGAATCDRTIATAKGWAVTG